MRQSWTIRARGVALLFAALSLGSPVVYAQMDSKPTVYVFRKVRMLAAPLELDMTLVTPVAPRAPVVLILFACGDGGLRGASKAVVQHMADQGYCVAAFSSPDALKELRQEDGKLRYAIALTSLTSVVGQAKRALKLPDDTPLVVTGMSRGASSTTSSCRRERRRPTTPPSMRTAGCRSTRPSNAWARRRSRSSRRPATTT